MIHSGLVPQPSPPELLTKSKNPGSKPQLPQAGRMPPEDSCPTPRQAVPDEPGFYTNVHIGLVPQPAPPELLTKSKNTGSKPQLPQAGRMPPEDSCPTTRQTLPPNAG